MAIATLEIDGDGVAADHPRRSGARDEPHVDGADRRADRRASIVSPQDATIRGAVITSGKPGRFVAGGDIHDFVSAHERGMSEAEAFEISHRWNVGMRRLERCGKPIAAAINGPALGGGFELALCCQHRVLVDDPNAVVGLVEVSLGLLPAGGGSQRLPRLIGADAALRSMIDARRWRPREALAAGLVDAIAAPEELLEVARARVRAGPSHRQPWDERVAPSADAIDAMRRRWQAEIDVRYAGRYPAPQALLEAVCEGLPLPLDEALRVESRCFAPLLIGVVARNLMRTGFVFRGQADRRARCAVSRGVACPVLDGPTHAGEAASETRLLLWPQADHAALAEIVQPPAANPAAAETAMAQAALRRATPVTLPPGRPSFVARLRLRWLAEAGDADRQLNATALEAARALGEGGVASAADADLASVLGAGYPAWTGGVMTHLDSLGLPGLPRFHPPSHEEPRT